MSVSSFLLEQVFRRLGVSAEARDHLRIASRLSDVGGKGFPPELFHLSAPGILRGLSNFAILQMERHWVYPFWVNHQLDPRSASFVPRSHNPLLLNVTQRNWTLLGTPGGTHEAIVDPRGLMTPLPREWSIDVWMASEETILFPSLSPTTRQHLTTPIPSLITIHDLPGIQIIVTCIVDKTKRGLDVLFCEIRWEQTRDTSANGLLGVAIRPFSPEGIAPIHQISFETDRQIQVNGSLGVIFSDTPDWRTTGSRDRGDTSSEFLKLGALLTQKDRTSFPPQTLDARCSFGLANALAIWNIATAASKQRTISFSCALGTTEELKSSSNAGRRRVSFSDRSEDHIAHWTEVLDEGADIQLPDGRLQGMLEANRATLLALHDGSSITPGPFVYHHFWIRDAAPMLHALDVLGFHRRVRKTLEAFPARMTSAGFIQAPDGEWDSNGAALWTIHQHIEITQSLLWARRQLPFLLRAARWIRTKRSESKETQRTHRGLLPESLSAEHFGTVDQYYWDSFWSLAGLRSVSSICGMLKNETTEKEWRYEAESLAAAIRASLHRVRLLRGDNRIPASPSRQFDESAIGSTAIVYPLRLTDIAVDESRETILALHRQYVTDRGFYHPIIHSGYNPYLTLQLAHAFLWLGDRHTAWSLAETIFHQCGPTYSLPEAIHPRTGGGAMGDGHHGWAAAEIVLFLRDCLVNDAGGSLTFLEGIPRSMLSPRASIRLRKLPTRFGPWDLEIQPVSGSESEILMRPSDNRWAKGLNAEIVLPFVVTDVSSMEPNHQPKWTVSETETRIGVSEGIRRLRIRH